MPVDGIVVDGTGSLDLAPATESKVGVIRLATPQEAQGGLISGAVAMTPAGSQAHGDFNYALKIHRHDWDHIDKKPTRYPPAPHNHDANYAPKTHRHRWDDIDGKPLTYPSAVHDHDDRYALKIHRHGWNDIDGKPATYPSTTHNHDERYAQQSGTYLSLRAQATTKADVGLANVPDYPITSEVTDSSNNKFATAGAVKEAYDAAKARQLEGGEVQVSGYLNYTSDPEGESGPMVMDYTVPTGCVMVGLYSDFSILSPMLNRWRVYYRTISLD